MARLKTPLAFALLSLAVPLGCASGPLVPRQSVRLGENEGILVIHTDSPLQIKHLRAEGFGGAWQQDSGDQISLVVVPAREYRWRTMRLLRKHINLRFTPPEDGRWSFRVRSGTICYPGSILASERGGYVGVRTINRSALVLPRLEQDFATLLDQYPLAYTGHVRDDFLEHYWNARRTKLSMSPATGISAERAP